MMTATAIALWVVRITGVMQVVLGAMLWMGKAVHLLPAHMVIGMTFVIGVWVLAGLAARAGLRWRHALPAVGWGFVVPGFGMLQLRLVPGPAHWVVEVVHLLIGIVAMGVAMRLGRFIRRSDRAGGRRGAVAGGVASGD
ncbi:MAG TPA: hypothetical protein VF212_08590 [Longimicrobiales bacterium]